MSGLLAQIGIAEEVVGSVPAVTAGEMVAGSVSGTPYEATLTFGSAHGIPVGSYITITGATPSGWNGTWPVVAVPTSTTLKFYSATDVTDLSSTMPTVTASQYGVVTTPARFYEFVSETLDLTTTRIDSGARRTGNRVLRSDRYVPVRTGAAGSVELEVASKGFGLWFKHMLGSIATAGPTDSAYTHTATLSTMAGRSLTVQVVRPFTDGYLQPFTYSGCKVAGWNLSCDVDGLLILSVDLDAYNEDTSTAKATASYPSTVELFSFAGGAVTIGGTAYRFCRSASVQASNGLDVDRRGLRSSGLKLEPQNAGDLDITFDLDCEFDSMVQRQRFASATASGAVAAVTLAWTAPTLIGATTYPSVTLTMPACRFDTGTVGVGGPDLLRQTLSGRVLNSTGGTNDAVTIIYVTADSTP